MPRAKIALLYVGGSIGMKANQKTGRIEPIKSVDDIFRILSELQKEVSLDFFPITTVGSSDITPEHWIEIADTIKTHYDRYEGFVVVHGTNTMTYTATAVAFALQSLSKPVVFTGAIMPIDDIASDGRTNLVYAIRAACLDIAEVCIAFGPRVFRAVRARKAGDSLLHTFDSPKYPTLIEFNTEPNLHASRIVRRKRTLQYRPEFMDNIFLLSLHPALHQSQLDAILAAKPNGIVMRTYGPGMLPDSLLPWIEEVVERKIPIVLTSKTYRGAVDLQRYRKQEILQKLGIISGKSMSSGCALVKLMWVLAQSKNTDRIRKLMEKDLVGEL